MNELKREAQQRAHTRIDDLLPLSWKRIEAKEHAEIMTFFEKNAAPPPRQGEDIHQLFAALDISDNLKRLEKESPDLAAILGRLDIKLNQLLQLSYPKADERPLIPTRVNLGGGGIAFWENHLPFAVGDFLEIRLALSVGTLAIVDLHVRVTEVGKPDTENLAKIACQFDPIQDDVREQIIQHVFKRQAALLRAKRKAVQKKP